MVSINDVAKRAGCSATLVSRVVNGQPGVSEKSRARIRQAIDELSYTPNLLARSLVLQKTDTVGVVVDTLCDAYFFDLIRGIEEEIEKQNYRVLFCSGGSGAGIKSKYIQFFMQERVDGIVVYGSKLDDRSFLEKLANSGFPFALIENDMGTMNVNNILLNNRYGSALAVDHLFACGCRSVFHVAGDADRQASERRRIGYVEAMEQHGVQVTPEMILPSGWTEEEGYRTIRTFLEEQGREGLPDAFYFSSDQTAFGGMRALTEAGVRIPEDVMLIGYDDDRPRRNDFPYLPLTTIRQPLAEMGRAAVRILLRDIREKRETKEKEMFYPSLVVRSTTREKKESAA